MPECTGETVAAALESVVPRTGVPATIVQDHGSDVRCGAKNFQESHPETVLSYDIRHKVAIEVKRLAEADPSWDAFMTAANTFSRRVHQTSLGGPCASVTAWQGALYEH